MRTLTLTLAQSSNTRMISNFSNKTRGVVGVVILLSLAGGVYLWWSTRPVYDDFGELKRRAELTLKAEQKFQPQADMEKVRATVKSALTQALSSADQPVDQADVEIISVKEKEWPDACLGVSQPEMVCAQVITPGYLVKALAASQIYEVHTDKDLATMYIIDSNGKVIN